MNRLAHCSGAGFDTARYFFEFGVVFLVRGNDNDVIQRETVPRTEKTSSTVRGYRALAPSGTLLFDLHPKLTGLSEVAGGEGALLHG